VALPLEFVCRCWAANECIVSALKVAAVVVCVWPGSAEAMPFFFQTCRCGELRVHGHSTSSITAEGYACFYTVLWMDDFLFVFNFDESMKAPPWREFWKKLRYYRMFEYIYT